MNFDLEFRAKKSAWIYYYSTNVKSGICRPWVTRCENSSYRTDLLLIRSIESETNDVFTYHQLSTICTLYGSVYCIFSKAERLMTILRLFLLRQFIGAEISVLQRIVRPGSSLNASKIVSFSDFYSPGPLRKNIFYSKITQKI